MDVSSGFLPFNVGAHCGYMNHKNRTRGFKKIPPAMSVAGGLRSVFVFGEEAKEPSPMLSFN